jgi:bifunctional NMN adenylyltransferase/nudix hydrolase
MKTNIESWTDHGIKPKQYDLAVVIGRFQPFHNAHEKLIERAKQHSHSVLALIGSSFIARNIKNPFTYDERVAMLPEDVVAVPLVDDLYNDQHWVASVQQHIEEELRNLYKDIKNRKVCIVGHEKDDSSRYLRWFPQYDFVEVPSLETLDSTTIRDILFGNEMIPADVMPQRVMDSIKAWRKNNPEIYQNLCDEHKYIKEYKAMWSNAPFQPVFVTTDAVVISQGHILLIKRRMAPGKGLWALPGGFLGPDEKIEDSMIRELEEETRIKVSGEMLRACTKGNHVFDHPRRSERGRTVTHAYLIVLQDRVLPKVRGSDDAERAKWVPLSEFYEMTDQMYEDHYSIATYMINRA